MSTEAQRQAKRDRWARNREEIAVHRRGVYKLRKLMGVCQTCNDAPAAVGRSRCAPCHEYMAEASRRHRAADPEATRAKARALYAANPERSRSYTAKWRNRPGYADYNREMGRRHRAMVRTATVAPFTAQQLAARMAYFGNQCWICAGPFEQVDHVKPLAKGGPHMLANLRPSCAPCNNRKRARWPLDKEDLRSVRSR